MKFDVLWDQIVAQNPSLSKEKVTMPTSTFKKAVHLAYETGKKSQTLKDSLGYGGDSLFGDFFGKNKG